MRRAVRALTWPFFGYVLLVWTVLDWAFCEKPFVQAWRDNVEPLRTRRNG